MDRRDWLFRFYRWNPSVASRDIYKAQRNRVVWLQRKAKHEYFHQLISRKSHPSAIWNTLKLVTSWLLLPPYLPATGLSTLILPPSPTLSMATLPLSAPPVFLHPLLHLIFSLLIHLPFPFPLPPLSVVRIFLLL